MRDPVSAKGGRVGVAAVQLAIAERLGWIFREQFQSDYGIDAQVEVTEGDEVVPRLLGLQIKGGPSWFREPGPGGWWFRPEQKHVRYWLNHVLPVVVVLYNPEAKTAYWQIVSPNTLKRTPRGGWKLLVPESQVLDDSARSPWREAAEGDPYVLRVRELQLARPWMEMLAAGKRLVIDIEEWVNKTSGRGLITLGIDSEDGEEPTPIAEWGVFLGLASYAEVVPALFAWADVGLHQETYEDAEYDRYESECIIYDSEGDRMVGQTYEEWRSGQYFESLRPYTNVAGEVDYWRLELTLNELGKAFLRVDEFAASGERQLTM